MCGPQECHERCRFRFYFLAWPLNFQFTWLHVEELLHNEARVRGDDVLPEDILQSARFRWALSYRYPCYPGVVGPLPNCRECEGLFIIEFRDLELPTPLEVWAEVVSGDDGLVFRVVDVAVSGVGRALLQYPVSKGQCSSDIGANGSHSVIPSAIEERDVLVHPVDNL